MMIFHPDPSVSECLENQDSHILVGGSICSLPEAHFAMNGEFDPVDPSIVTFGFDPWTNCTKTSLCKQFYNTDSYSMTTIVTGWWDLGSRSKHKKRLYLNSIARFKEIHTRKILFTDDPLLFENWTETLVVYKNISHMEALSGYSREQWLNQRDIDIESHREELYMIWIGRPWLLQEAIDLDPFRTKWFFWVDIGAVRNYHNPAFDEPIFFSPHGLAKDKMTFFTPFTQAQVKIC